VSSWLRELFVGADEGVRPHWRRGSNIRVNLANNEMRHPAVNRLISAAAGRLRAEDWNSYPDYAAYRAQFAEALGVPAESLLFTAGSDQTYRAVFDAFGTTRRRLLTQRPNYSQIFSYAVLRRMTVGTVAYWPGAGFRLADLLTALGDTPPGSIVAVSNPNGPTGAWWPADDLAVLAEACDRQRCLLVVDEAYAAFAPDTFLPAAPRWPHVIVVRSFSKAYGMAGGRLAVAVCGSPEVAGHVQRWNVTNPVSGPALRVAAELLGRQEELTAVYAELDAARSLLTTVAPGLVGGRAETSWGNFVPIRCPDEAHASRCVERLATHGYAVRNLDRFGLPGYLRISTADLNTVHGFLDALRATAEELVTQ
jgi:histidinol-phosphate aminotransferase